MNKPSPSFLTRCGGFLVARSIHSWMKTLDYRAYYYDPEVDPTRPDQKPRIYVFWHEYILLPLYLRGNCDLAMLLSRHRDADILERVALHFGFDCVRGSTNRGSLAALRELIQRGQHMHLAITPDGPRGPRRQLAQGPIYLASKLQIPLVPFGMGIDRLWRAKSWDRFAVPHPCAKGRAVVGPALSIPPDLNRTETESYRLRVENLLNKLSGHAEVWAKSGKRLPGEVVVHRQGRHLSPSWDQPSRMCFQSAEEMPGPQLLALPNQEHLPPGSTHREVV